MQVRIVLLLLAVNVRAVEVDVKRKDKLLEEKKKSSLSDEKKRTTALDEKKKAAVMTDEKKKNTGLDEKKKATVVMDEKKRDTVLDVKRKATVKSHELKASSAHETSRGGSTAHSKELIDGQSKEKRATAVAVPASSLSASGVSFTTVLHGAIALACVCVVVISAYIEIGLTARPYSRAIAALALVAVIGAITHHLLPAHWVTVSLVIT